MNAIRKTKAENEVKQCKHCKAEIFSKRSDSKYCSHSCRQMGYIERKAFTIYGIDYSELLKTPVLRLIKGGRYDFFTRERRIEQFWSFCHATLWNNEQFEAAQVEEFKKLIAEHFRKFIDADNAFKELVERVCLAHRYVARRQSRYISKPIDWLNINFSNGLTGTESWYKSVQEQRKTVPHYNEGILTLSRAVLNYCKTRNVFDILNYRRELIKQKQFDLLQIYMNAIPHILYFNV